MRGSALTESARPLNFTILQAGRGIAALLVVFYHASMVIASPKYWGGPVFGGVFSFGHAGVPFFFVLSGFIILWIHRRDIGRPERVRTYLWRRAVRIYPPYWAVSLFVIAVYLAAPAYRHGGDLDPGALIRSFALMGAPASVLPVGWSLFYEILFYALFAILILNWRAGLAAFALWFALCVAIPNATYLTSTFNLLFAMGLAAAWLVRRHKIPWPTFFFWGGIAAFCAVAFWEKYAAVEPGAPPLLYGIGPALFLLGAVELERSRGWRAPRPLALLGDASYSLYLVHYLVVSALAKTILWLPKEAAFFVFVGASILGGLVFHFLFEKPMLAKLGRGSRRPRAA